MWTAPEEVEKVTVIISCAELIVWINIVNMTGDGKCHERKT